MGKSSTLLGIKIKLNKNYADYEEIKKKIDKLPEETNINSKIVIITDYIEKLILSKLAVYIAEKRKEKGFSVRKLNEISGVSLAVINDLEKARSMPRMETLIRLSLALETDFNETFKALLLTDITTKSKNETDLAMDLSKYGYNKDQVSDIMNYIKFINYKSEQKKLK